MGIPLAASDRLSLLFIALLCLVVVSLMPFSTSFAVLLAVYLLVALSLLFVARWRSGANAGNTAFYLHVGFTVAMVLVLFSSLGELIPGIRSARYDDVLIRIDHTLFGVHPTVWLERLISPGLTALLQFAYLSYYFIPVSVGVVLIARGKRTAFEESLFGIVLCFYLSYLGYLLMPAVGPRFTLGHLQTTGLQAWPFIAALQDGLDRLEHNKTDAFPSGHTAIALTSLWYAWKHRERMLTAVLVPVVAALLVSTVYLRYHYVIDVIAGMALAAVTIIAAPSLERALSGTTGGSGEQRHDTA